MIFARVSFEDKLLFTKHLSVMLKSGIPLTEVLEILEKQSTNASFKKIIHHIQSDVAAGKTLESALAKHRHIFDSLYLSLVSIGEESGTLEKNLTYLASLLAKQYEFQKKLQGAMLYPTFVLAIAVVVGGGVSIFVLPKLADLFQSLDTALPPTTVALLWFANLMKQYGVLLGSVSILFLILLFIVSKTKQVKPSWEKLLLSIPVVQKFTEYSQTAQFARNFSILLTSGVPINRTLAVLAETTNHSVYKGYIKQIEQVVSAGKPLEPELAKSHFSHFPPLVAKMVGVGEKSGKLSESLEYIATFFEEEVDGLTKNLPTILEPILLTAIALIVGFLALAIISPIYNLTGSISR